MLISMIAAMSRNRVIGHNGGLPWYSPVDLARFRALTMGRPLIMGRKTHESIGRPLAGRLNIVVTRQSDYRAVDCLVAGSLEQALSLSGPVDEVFICGGGEIYLQALPMADKLYLTILDQDFSGDTFFPEIPPAEFEEIMRETPVEAPGLQFVVMERLAAAVSSPVTRLP